MVNPATLDRFDALQQETGRISLEDINYSYKAFIKTWFGWYADVDNIIVFYNGRLI